MERRKIIGYEEHSEVAQPVDMILHCPNCGWQHVDKPDTWPDSRKDVPIHRSHKCEICGFIWRPADVPTNGVAAIKTQGKWDRPISQYIAGTSQHSMMMRWRKKTEILMAAIRWALGYPANGVYGRSGPPFDDLLDAQGNRPKPYWWRTELRRRVDVSVDVETFIEQGETHESSGTRSHFER